MILWVSRDLNIDLISDASGRILVDLVFHYERLSEFEKYMLGEYGLNIHFRTGRRAKANLKQNVKLDSEDVNLIKKNYAREIEFFGFSTLFYLIRHDVKEMKQCAETSNHSIESLPLARKQNVCDKCQFKSTCLNGGTLESLKRKRILSLASSSN